MKSFLVTAIFLLILGLAPFSRAASANQANNLKSSAVNAWSEPVNLSTSGTTSKPRLLALPDGRMQAFWWDRYDGIMTTYYDGTLWSTPAKIPLSTTTFKSMPTLIADKTGWIYAFWNEPGDPNSPGFALAASQMTFGSKKWGSSTLLGTSVLTFDVSAQPEKGITLAYMVGLNTAKASAGIYVRQNPGGGSTWLEGKS